MLTSYDLMPFFWVGLTCLLTLILLLLSPTVAVRSWYLAVFISLAPWARLILSMSVQPLPLWFYVLPGLWIVLTLWLAFPPTRSVKLPSLSGEPQTTLEHIRGRAGTTEALRLYFTLVFLVSVAGLTFFKIVVSSRF